MNLLLLICRIAEQPCRKDFCHRQGRKVFIRLLRKLAYGDRHIFGGKISFVCLRRPPHLWREDFIRLPAATATSLAGSRRQSHSICRGFLTKYIFSTLLRKANLRLVGFIFPIHFKKTPALVDKSLSERSFSSCFFVLIRKLIEKP